MDGMSAKRILVVDDESEIVDLLVDLLSSRGFEVNAASNATGAIDLVRKHIFDAAILDFNLPDMNGVMLHRQLRQMDKELAEHTLFTSGFAQSSQNLGYYASCGVGFLSKPFEANELLESLHSMWQKPEA